LGRALEKFQYESFNSLWSKHRESLEDLLAEALYQVGLERGCSVVVAGSLTYADNSKKLSVKKATDLAGAQEQVAERLSLIARTGNSVKTRLE